ncbi:hypothetical protein SKAU_G00277660 [Synaphobranchus kaupii]|uniref:Uncharacterized protein n=1 Tax=Synaphobranchus kaupii TaxID=118154 RepID=A0A9Q1EWH5_SYNKA|nr:hypothetical protein SKAU_G00277660 [Synaphobranchus kaupii]
MRQEPDSGPARRGCAEEGERGECTGRGTAPETMEPSVPGIQRSGVRSTKHPPVPQSACARSAGHCLSAVVTVRVTLHPDCPTTRRTCKYHVACPIQSETSA